MADEEKVTVPSGGSARPAGASRKAARPAVETELDVDVGANLHRFRTEASWSIQRLAKEASVSTATIHKIEKGTMVPSIHVLLKLARALGRSVGDLVAEEYPEVEQRFALFRKDRRPTLSFADFPVSIQATTGKLPDRQLEAGIYVVEQGGSTTSEPLTHAGEKIYMVLTGAVRFEIGDRAFVLSPGDVLHLKADLPHRWENVADGSSEFFFCLTPPLGKQRLA